MDLKGQTINRWSLSPPEKEWPLGGYGYTDHNWLYALKREGRQGFQRLMFYDRNTSSWKPANDEKYPLSYRLLGVDGNQLVMCDRYIDPTLMWFPTP